MSENDSLTSRQERFCQLYAVSGNATKAAIGAGYSERGAGQQGCELLKNPKVLTRAQGLQAEFTARQKARLIGLADAAIAALEDTLEGAAPNSMARVRACECILDRAGHRPAERIAAHVATLDLGSIDEDEAHRIVAQAREVLGLSPAFLIPYQAQSIEEWASDPDGSKQ